MFVSEFEQQVAKLYYSFSKIVNKDLVCILGKYKTLAITMLHLIKVEKWPGNT